MLICSAVLMFGPAMNLRVDPSLPLLAFILAAFVRRGWTPRVFGRSLVAIDVKPSRTQFK